MSGNYMFAKNGCHLGPQDIIEYSEGGIGIILQGYILKSHTQGREPLS